MVKEKALDPNMESAERAENEARSSDEKLGEGMEVDEGGDGAPSLTVSTVA